MWSYGSISPLTILAAPAIVNFPVTVVIYRAGTLLAGLADGSIHVVFTRRTLVKGCSSKPFFGGSGKYQYYFFKGTQKWL